MKKILILPLVLLSCLLQAQTIDYQQFMQRVARDNAQLLAEQYNVEIAAANLLDAADSQSDKLTATAHLWASLGID